MAMMFPFAKFMLWQSCLLRCCDSLCEEAATGLINQTGRQNHSASQCLRLLPVDFVDKIVSFLYILVSSVCKLA